MVSLLPELHSSRSHTTFCFQHLLIYALVRMCWFLWVFVFFFFFRARFNLSLLFWHLISEKGVGNRSK